MNAFLICVAIISLGLFLAGRRHPAGICRRLAPFVLLVSVAAVILRLVSYEPRLASGTDEAAISARAVHLSRAIVDFAARDRLNSRRLLVLLPAAPADNALISDEPQILVERLRQELPLWEVISKEALEVDARAVTCSHFDRALKNERCDVILSLIGLPQDLENCAQSSSFPSNASDRTVPFVVGSGIVNDLAGALERHLFDLALVDASAHNCQLGGRCLNFGSETVLEIGPETAKTSVKNEP